MQTLFAALIDGKEAAFLTRDELIQLAQDGHIRANTSIRLQSETKWHRASQVRGLAPFLRSVPSMANRDTRPPQHPNGSTSMPGRQFQNANGDCVSSTNCIGKADEEPVCVTEYVGDTRNPQTSPKRSHAENHPQPHLSQCVAPPCESPTKIACLWTLGCLLIFASFGAMVVNLLQSLMYIVVGSLLVPPIWNHLVEIYPDLRRPGRHILWIPFLLTGVFALPDSNTVSNRNVPPDVAPNRDTNSFIPTSRNSSRSTSSSKTIDDIHYDAYRRDMERLGLNPDMQSEAEVRAVNKFLRDRGMW